MRKIKFRAWDRYFTKMVGWKYLIEQCDIDYLFGNYLLPDEEKRITVPNFVVMQYTGLKDMNGKEIYEGDIVKMHYFFDNFDLITLGAYEDEKEIIGVVGIDEMGTYTVCDDDKYYWLNYMEYPQEELEIIGNIYNNPELLKNKNKEED